MVDLHLLLLAGAANFMFIGMKAFQQINVIHQHRLRVMITSNLLAFAEVFVIFTIAQRGFYLPLVLTIGMSGGLGALFAMRLHKWLKR